MGFLLALVAAKSPGVKLEVHQNGRTCSQRVHMDAADTDAQTQEFWAGSSNKRLFASRQETSVFWRTNADDLSTIAGIEIIQYIEQARCRSGRLPPTIAHHVVRALAELIPSIACPQSAEMSLVFCLGEGEEGGELSTRGAHTAAKGTDPWEGLPTCFRGVSLPESSLY